MDPKTLPASAPVAAPAVAPVVAPASSPAAPGAVDAAPAAESGKDSAVADSGKDTASDTAADTGVVVDADAAPLLPFHEETSIVGLLVLILSGANVFLRKAQKALRGGVEQAQAEVARISGLLVKAEGRIADLEGLVSRVEEAEKHIKALKAVKK